MYACMNVCVSVTHVYLQCTVYDSIVFFVEQVYNSDANRIEIGPYDFNDLTPSTIERLLDLNDQQLLQGLFHC